MVAWSVPIPLDARCFLSLLAMLTLACSHADSCTENYQTSCPTTVTASTSIGVSLVQAISMNRRVDAARVTESLLGQDDREGQMDHGVREVGSDATGPRGQRDLEMARGAPHDYGKAAAAIGEESEDSVAQTSMRPVYIQPLLAAQPGSDSDTKDGVSATSSGVEAVWKSLRKLRDHLRILTDNVKSLPLLQQVVKYRTGLASFNMARGSTGLIFVFILLIVLSCIFWKATRPEPVNGSLKLSSWSQSPTYPRLSPVIRSPAGTSVPVGEPRHIARGAAAGTFGADASTMGGGIQDSSEDEGNSVARDGDGFCPDLVVPQQCECILVVPVYAPVGSFSISDMNGRPVLQANTQMQGQGLLWQLHLQTATGESLARCIEVRPNGPGSSMSLGNVEFHISDAKGNHFATLMQVQGQQRFELTTQNGFKLHFYGNFQTQAVNITDKEDSLLATTEPCGEDFDQTGIYYRLRVAPLANVGHSLCALLCIGQILRHK